MSVMTSAGIALRLRRWSGAGPADWRLYHEMIAERLRPGMTVVDVGCGDGAVQPFPWEEHPGVRLIGLDPDPAAEANAALGAFRLLEPGREWPLEAASADLVLARYVLEHVESPQSFLTNARRALKPGGELLFLTPNRRHPAMLVSAALPLAWKRRILGRARGTAEDDVFPTHYRMNTPGPLARRLREAGFAIERLETRELEPCGYLEGVPAAYAAACLWYGFVSASGLERWIGAHILGAARKTS